MSETRKSFSNNNLQNNFFFFLAIRALASKLVEQWLKTVKGEYVVPIQEGDLAQIISNANSEIKSENPGSEEHSEDVKVKIELDLEKNVESDNNLKLGDLSEPLDIKENIAKKIEVKEEEEETLPVLKITLKDGKQVLSQVDEESKEESSDTEKAKEKSKHKNKEKTSDRNSSSSSKSSSSKHSSKSHSSSSDKHKSSNKSSSSSSSSSRNKDKDVKTKEKDKHSHSSKSKSDSSKKSSDRNANARSSSSSRSKDDRSTNRSDKERHRDKDKTQDKDKNLDKNRGDKTKDIPRSPNDKNEEKSQTPSIQKLGKIPKLSDVKKEKPSISIEVRKPDEPKPKTVKTFHSKFRKHGLEEEIKPPPSRAALLNKKVTPALPPTVSIPKRPSPVHTETPPEKKPKTVEPVEKPGSIKLIPPKPKRKYYFLKFRYYLLLMFLIFTGSTHRPVSVMVASHTFSLVRNNVSGKSKMYNITGSKVFISLVKCYLQIKTEFIRQYLSFNIDLNLFKE